VISSSNKVKFLKNSIFIGCMGTLKTILGMAAGTAMFLSMNPANAKYELPLLRDLDEKIQSCAEVEGKHSFDNVLIEEYIRGDKQNGKSPITFTAYYPTTDKDRLAQVESWENGTSLDEQLRKTHEKIWKSAVKMNLRTAYEGTKGGEAYNELVGNDKELFNNLFNSYFDEKNEKTLIELMNDNETLAVLLGFYNERYKDIIKEGFDVLAYSSVDRLVAKSKLIVTRGHGHDSIPLYISPETYRNDVAEYMDRNLLSGKFSVEGELKCTTYRDSEESRKRLGAIKVDHSMKNSNELWLQKADFKDMLYDSLHANVNGITRSDEPKPKFILYLDVTGIKKTADIESFNRD